MASQLACLDQEMLKQRREREEREKSEVGYSQTSAAKRMRKLRQKQKDEMAADADEPDEKEERPKARPRLSGVKKQLVAAGASLSPAGKRFWTASEKKFVYDACNNMNCNWSQVARYLQRNFPISFGDDSLKPISYATVASIYRSFSEAIPILTAGPSLLLLDRPLSDSTSILPTAVVEDILLCFRALIKRKTVRCTARVLQCVAKKIIEQSGNGHLLSTGEKRDRKFKCSLSWILRLLRQHDFRSVQPCGNSRKLPDDYVVKCEHMMLRLAYFVRQFSLPRALIVNADHTGIMMMQQRGPMWIGADDDKTIQGFGDHRQFTALVSSAADGATLPLQLILQGKTSASFPRFAGVTYSQTMSLTEAGPRGGAAKTTVCFIPQAIGESPIKNIGSACVTYNHWADITTSKAYVQVETEREMRER